MKGATGQVATGMSGRFGGVASCKRADPPFRMPHLDENAMAAFLEGKLAPPEVARVDEHVDGCEECRALLAVVTKASLLPHEATTTPSGLGPTLSGAALPVAPGAVIDDKYRVDRV